MKRAILTLSLIALSSSRLFAADPMLQEYSEALALEREAEKGDKEAALKLGRFYDSNLSNEAKAIHWFSKRCGRWNSKCAFDIGRIYQLDSNYVKAKFWFEKAYKMGSADGAFMTGVVISEYESDEETAMKWYEIAHKMGSKDAGIEIGFIYYGLYDDLEKAAEWYEKSYKLGNLKAVIKLGMLYRDDIKDYKKALEWFMIAYKN
ncbi:MAG: sel1 repeat family protein, partial [Helicobacteraceae bacterium]|nr:sel1 repeat family protein [Helicobacteraceae bacterium]